MAEPRPCNLVHITTVPGSLGFLRGQIGFMKAHGLTIEAISSPGEKLEAFAAREGVSVHAVEMPRSITPLGDLKALRKLVALLKRIKPDIVHSHTPKGGLLGMIAAWLARVPVRIYHMRGLPMMTATGWKRRLLTMTEKISCRLAHRVICVSHSMRQYAINAGLCPAEKIVTFHGGSGNGVDAEGRFNPDAQEPATRATLRARLGIPADALVVGFVGRVTRDKGIIELAEAWAALRERFPALHLLLLGPLEPQDPLPPDVLQALRQDPRVHLLGAVSDTPPYYTAMDVLCLPTYREGFPNVPLEAAAMRLPVVATRIPGCVDAVVDGETGLLAPPYDAPALAEALARYFDDPALREAHGQAGYVRVRRDFRPQAIWEAIYHEYQTLLGPCASPAKGPASHTQPCDDRG